MLSLSQALLLALPKCKVWSLLLNTERVSASQTEAGEYFQIGGKVGPCATDIYKKHSPWPQLLCLVGGVV